MLRDSVVTFLNKVLSYVVLSQSEDFLINLFWNYSIQIPISRKVLKITTFIINVVHDQDKCFENITSFKARIKKISALKNTLNFCLFSPESQWVRILQKKQRRWKVVNIMNANVKFLELFDLVDFSEKKPR